jgi:hypothetical protein
MILFLIIIIAVLIYKKVKKDKAYETLFNTLVELVGENNVKEVITTSSDDRITALFNLFSFKDEWETENTSEAICEVLFMDEEEEVYAFSKTPDNWMVFLGYIFRLVGGSL